MWGIFKVPPNPKLFFRKYNTLYLFPKHLNFISSCRLFYACQNLRQTKHHLVHDQVIRGVGLFPSWCHKLLCIHVYKDLSRCKSVCDVNWWIDPCPLLAQLCDRWCLDFVSFTAYKKSRFGYKKLPKGAMCFEKVSRFVLVEKIFWVRATLTSRHSNLLWLKSLSVDICKMKQFNAKQLLTVKWPLR